MGGALLLGTVAVADAGPIERREHRQMRRIAAGIRSGALTRKEAARLLAGQARIRLEERHFRRTGGRLGPREWLRLQRDLNRASRHIYWQKHDSQHR